MHDEVTVVILAAGLGTRMKSKQAKVLHQAGGRTLIEHAVDTALAVAAPERTFLVAGHQADRVREAVRKSGARFIDQTEQRGTGHALLCGQQQLKDLGGLLLIYYGDCPLILPSTLVNLIAHQTEHEGAATLLTTRLKDPTGYGRVVRGDSGDIVGIVEQKAANLAQLRIHEINAGVYCFRAELFWDAIAELRPTNAANEYYLTDMVEILIRRGHAIHAMEVKDSSELLGINNRLDLAAVDQVFRSRKAHQLMLDGVTIEKPETVTIDSQVRVGIDTVIGPFVQLRGETVIGEACTIGAGCIITDSDLADEVEVGPFTIIGTSKLDRGAHAGPYARLRMGNHLAAGARVGNFVEMKKAALGAGSKALHLAYLGDTTIGDASNIGAGTITCNYDGTHKNPTTIGDHAFIGSNSTLVAPLEIASGSYIAAGSVITRMVPEDALAIGRARQENKEGYAKKLRKT